MPDPMEAAARSLAATTPSGIPHASGLAATMTSGSTGGSIICRRNKFPAGPRRIGFHRRLKVRCSDQPVGEPYAHTPSTGINATLALHQFDDDSACVVVNHLLKRGNVIARYKMDPGQQRLEIPAVLFLAGDGERAKGAA